MHVLRTSFLFLLAAASAAAQPRPPVQVIGSNHPNLNEIYTVTPAAADFESDLIEPHSGRLYIVPPIAQADLPPFRMAPDGTKYQLLRFHSAGAAAVKLHFTEFHLPPQAEVFVYGVEESGAPGQVFGPFRAAGPLSSGSFWTLPLKGPSAVVELRLEGEPQIELPFRVGHLAHLRETSELERVSASEPAAPSSFRDVRTSSYQGVPITYEVRDGWAIVEGDILLGPAAELEFSRNLKAAQAGGEQRFSIGITGTQYRWLVGLVPYVVDPAITQQSSVTAAVNHWNSRMGGVIRWIPRTTQTNYVKFTHNSDASHCSSYVGMINAGEQPINLGDYCSTGNIIHEMGHAVGLWHEHCREDRDTKVVINWANIQTGAELNFQQNIANGDDINAYDYGSIMHYGAYAFSSNGQPTITTIPPGISIGQRDGLSVADIAGVKRLYGAYARR
jgi:astacin